MKQEPKCDTSSPITDNRKVLEDRILRNREVTPEGHWLWLGYIQPSGYGSFQIGRTTYYAHRTSAHLYLGLDLKDSDQQACHKRECLMRHCFNPDHLYVGDAASNIEDMMEMGRHVSWNRDWTHCKHGHEFTSENTYTWTGKAGYSRRDCRECNRIKDRMPALLRRMACALLVA